jgi:hypothetical protein
MDTARRQLVLPVRQIYLIVAAQTPPTGFSNRQKNDCFKKFEENLDIL